MLLAVVKQQIPTVLSLVLPDQESNPLSYILVLFYDVPNVVIYAIYESSLYTHIL
jgi:hypothetical protein